jgi:hypothetical protein
VNDGGAGYFNISTQRETGTMQQRARQVVTLMPNDPALRRKELKKNHQHHRSMDLVECAPEERADRLLPGKSIYGSQKRLS